MILTSQCSFELFCNEKLRSTMFKFAVVHAFSELTLKLASPGKSLFCQLLPLLFFPKYFSSLFCQRLLSVENTPFRISLLYAGRKQMRFPLTWKFAQSRSQSPRVFWSHLESHAKHSTKLSSLRF